jgi:prepilin-type N-terminal cleavage/methylation domain-containing protein
MRQKGFTIVELIAALSAVLGLALTGLMIWAVLHFVLKFW